VKELKSDISVAKTCGETQKTPERHQDETGNVELHPDILVIIALGSSMRRSRLLRVRKISSEQIWHDGLLIGIYRHLQRNEHYASSAEPVVHLFDH